MVVRLVSLDIVMIVETDWRADHSLEGMGDTIAKLTGMNPEAFHVVSVSGERQEDGRWLATTKARLLIKLPGA